MPNAEQGGEDQQNASHESRFEQEEDDGHVTLTTLHDKTEGTMQSSSVSSDFTSKLLNLDITGPDVNEIASLMNTSTVLPLPPPVNPSSHLTTIPQQQTPNSTTTITNPTINLPEIPNFASLFQFDQRVSTLETKMALSSVRSVLHDIASNLEMDYLPKRHWSNLEMKRSRIMVKAIDKLLFERRLMRNLEKFVGGRDYENDLRLLEQTI
ncbi:hypothetical protein Tco_0330810 [Tanacetum coccineum]